MFFLKKIPDFQAFEQEKLLIRVSDYKLLGTNALIGEIELAISPFYFSENHSLLHQWVALTNNYKENKNEIQGFVKFSANLVGPGDQASKLEPEAPKDEKKSENLPVIYSPQIQTKCFQIKIQLIKGENLVKMDNMLGSIDSYLLFRFGSSFFKTEVVKNTINPFWGYQILVIIITIIYLYNIHNKKSCLMLSRVLMNTLRFKYSIGICPKKMKL